MEYQKAQDSAEHHDKLLWQMTSMFWAGNLVLLGFIINCLKDNTQNFSFKIILAIICALGAILMIFMEVFGYSFGCIRRQKYQRCREIELKLGLRQHLNLNCQEYGQTILYFLISMSFVFIWICLFFIILVPMCYPYIWKFLLFLCR